MFEDLNQKIRRENIELIKKKSRYIQKELVSDRFKYQLSQQISQVDQPKQLFVDKIKSQSRRFKPSIDGFQNIFQHNSDQQSSMSSDSLSNYQLQEREEMFNLLIQKKTLQHQSSNYQYSLPRKPYQNEFMIQSNNYYSPQNSIKQLQHTIELSQQKLRLTQESYDKQIQSISYQHSLTVQEMKVKIQQLELMVKHENDKIVRIQEIQKQNRLLKESLQTYEQKYWGYQQLQQKLNKTQAQNNKLTIQLTQVKNKLQLIECMNYNSKQNNLNKQNQLNMQNTPPNDSQSIMHNKNNEHQQTIRNSHLQIQQIKQLQKTIFKLQGKLTLLEHQLQSDKSYYQQQLLSYQKTIQNLQTELNHKNKIINQSQSRINQLQQQKERVEKSLLFTMDSFSKHLQVQSQSAHISQTKLVKMSPQKWLKRQTSIFPKPTQQIHQQETLNLDLNQSLALKQKHSHQQLQSISPVHIKHSTNSISQAYQHPTRNDYIKQQQIKQHQRTRIMSHQQYTNHKLPKHILHNNPERQLTQQGKIAKLEKKLQVANTKIVELLKQKLQKASTLTFR